MPTCQLSSPAYSLWPPVSVHMALPGRDQLQLSPGLVPAVRLTGLEGEITCFLPKPYGQLSGTGRRQPLCHDDGFAFSLTRSLTEGTAPKVSEPAELLMSPGPHQLPLPLGSDAVSRARKRHQRSSVCCESTLTSVLFGHTKESWWSSLLTLEAKGM